MEQMSLDLKQRNKLVLNIDNFSGILREFLFDDVITLSDLDEEIYIEMFLETLPGHFSDISEP